MPKEGQEDAKGRKFVAGKWRSTEEIHAMAEYSVIEQLRYSGPLTREEICKKTGLAEIRAARAIETCLKTGKILTAGQGRYYVPEKT